MAVIRGEQLGSSWVASGDLSSYQYRIMVQGADTNYRVYLSTASGAAPCGVLQNKPRHLEHASIVDAGHTKIFLGGSMASGAEFMMNNAGAAISTSSGGAVMGRLHTGGDSGTIGEAMVWGPGYVKSA